VVDSIAQDDTIESVEVIRVGAAAEAFNAIEAFRTFEGEREKRVAEMRRKADEELDKLAAGFDKTPSGLRYKIIQKGSGTPAEKGKQISVHYKGQLADGRVFDSSYQRKEPIDFTVGIGQVIKGWDEGLQLLRVGDKARLVIPSDLAYGSQGAGGVIPPDATLIFDVELMNVS
jgi:FKBP-type peptidyl-prolyl cis-trans isomerase